jgi:methanogenic corrinoid protein MtbC1
MKEVFITCSDGSTLGQRRILSGVFKNDTAKVMRCDLFSHLLAQGYGVLHVGTNVEPALFIQQMQKFTPRVIILICQGKVDYIKQLIELIKEEDMRSMARIILYGPDIEGTVRDEVHADAYAENEQELLDMVDEIMTETFYEYAHCFSYNRNPDS